MSRIFKRKDDIKVVRIRPEGWVEDIIFNFDGFHSCGQAEAGVGVSLSGSRGGGVMTLDDIVELQLALAYHMRKVSKAIETGELKSTFDWLDEEELKCEDKSEGSSCSCETQTTNCDCSSEHSRCNC